MTDQQTPDTPHNRMSGPIHGWFSLSYCNYQVLNRTLMQCMPLAWQERMVACLEELRAAFEDVPQAEGFHVEAATEHEVSDLDEALVQLARDGWLRTEPGEGFEPVRERVLQCEPEDPSGLAAVPQPEERA